MLVVITVFSWLGTLFMTNSLNCLSVLSLLSVWSLLSCNSVLLGPFYSGAFLSMGSLSGLLVSLSVWVTLLMYLVSQKKEYIFNLMVGALLMVVVLFFLVDQWMLFYVLFEVSLLPTLFLILKWGYQPERLQAGVYFMMYTVCASLPLLASLLMLYGDLGHGSLEAACPLVSYPVVGYNWGLRACFFMPFLVKVPMWGVHLWLPKAHVEAPVSGSMILAGVLLKLGGYGLMKIYLLVLSYGDCVSPFFSALSLWGSFVVSFVCIRQVDVKSLIAYSSVIHMALMVLGVLWGNVSGWMGSGMMMVAHGFSSSGLFVLASSTYLASSSRNLLLYKGMVMVYPVSGIFWFVLLMANMAAPPSLSLAAELLIYKSVLSISCGVGLVLGSCTFMAAAYNLYIYSSQQGKPSSLLYPSQIWTDSLMLSSVLHIVPVYGLILCMSSFS